MVVKGDVDEIRFRNDENGYTILVLDVGGEPLVCVGTFPPITEGETLELTGTRIVHPRFGPQFKATEIKTCEPATDDAVVRYLGSGVIRNLGPKTAFAIVAKFGGDTLKILEFEPHKLAQIRGISRDKALAFGAEYSKVKAMREAVMFLQSLGLSLNLSFKIYKVYGLDTQAVVKTNPYLLIEDVDGIGFATADKIAERSGIAKDSAFRIRAGIIFTLKEAADKNGNTFLPKEELADFAARLLDQDTGRIYEEIEELVLARRVKLAQNGEGVMLPSLYKAEKGAAARLAEMIVKQNMLAGDVSDLIAQFECVENMKLHSAQRAAVQAAIASGVSVITGGPGTGKTTIIKCILYILNAQKTETVLTAPTGRAAKRLCESTGAEASTIHRALMGLCGGQFSAGAVIVDEVSMVDIYLMHQLLSALHSETKLVLVGDKNQLPSVGAGNVLSDILASGVVTVTELEHVYRQDEESLIVLNAHRINAGEMPDLAQRDRDFFFVEAFGADDVANKTEGLIAKRLPAYLNCDSSAIQILCPMKNGAAGTLKLNERLADILNDCSDKREITEGDQRFRTGDKVMHIANNYELSWRRETGSRVEHGEGVFNGDAGRIQSVNPQSGEIAVRFEDGRIAFYTRDIISQLVLSYAVTIHKSQGSEFEAVIIPIVSGNFMILTRNLLYTAVTRARKLVVLVGDRNTVRRMIENNYIQKRYSCFCAFLQEAVGKAEILWGTEPATATNREE